MSLIDLNIVKDLRRVKYDFSFKAYKFAADHLSKERVEKAPIHFIVGCGRTGTTILGDIISSHPKVRYLFEPYARWASLSPVLDHLGFYYKADEISSVDLDQLKSSEDFKSKAYSLFTGLPSMTNRNSSIIVEKTPLNIFYIDLLNSVFPKSKFIITKRSPWKTIRSIMQICKNNTYKINYPKYHQWWGCDSIRKKNIYTRYINMFPEYHLDYQELDDLSFAIMEWVLSEAIGRKLIKSGISSLEVRYEKLCAPHKTKILKELFGFLGLKVTNDLLENLAARIRIEKGLYNKKDFCTEYDVTDLNKNLFKTLSSLAEDYV